MVRRPSTLISFPNLVPKLSLGTLISEPKLNLGNKVVPKCNLGTRRTENGA